MNLLRVAAAVPVLGLTFYCAACDVDVEEDGAVEITPADVDVEGRETTITVPDIDVEMREKTVTVPDIDVTPRGDADGDVDPEPIDSVE